MHSRSICHRDVKLDNVLLYKHTQEVRLADYGLGEFVEKGKKLKLLCGTPAYVAPVRTPVPRLSSCSSMILNCWVAQEIVENKQYSGTAVDVWSLGVLLFITVTGHSPYKGKVRRSVHTSDVAAAAADSATCLGRRTTTCCGLSCGPACRPARRAGPSCPRSCRTSSQSCCR